MTRAISWTVLAAMLVATVPSLAQPVPSTRPAPGAQRPPGGGNPGMTRPAPARPAPGRPAIQPPRPGPGTGGPQIQPPRPGPGRPEIQPPRPQPGRPEIQPPRPGPGRPEIQPPRPSRPGGGNNYRPAPPNYRPGYWQGTRYRYPNGYRYQRYGVGVRIPPVYWGSSYWWITDWQLWGLPSYSYGYRWVRVGPDALLVNTSTGRVVAVRYDFFW